MLWHVTQQPLQFTVAKLWVLWRLTYMVAGALDYGTGYYIQRLHIPAASAYTNDQGDSNLSIVQSEACRYGHG